MLIFWCPNLFYLSPNKNFLSCKWAFIFMWQSKRRILKGIIAYIHVCNRTFLVHFGSISGEFGRAMVGILVRHNRGKIPMARPNEPDMPPKHTKKVWLGIYCTWIQPKFSITYGNKICQALYRVARKENNTSQLTNANKQGKKWWMKNNFTLSVIQWE